MMDVTSYRPGWRQGSAPRVRQALDQAVIRADGFAPVCDDQVKALLVGALMVLQSRVRVVADGGSGKFFQAALT